MDTFEPYTLTFDAHVSSFNPASLFDPPTLVYSTQTALLTLFEPYMLTFDELPLYDTEGLASDKGMEGDEIDRW